jgi:hypothetical protein
MFMRYFLAVILSLNFLTDLHAQVHEIAGRVIDAESRVALPFVNIVINNGPKCGTSDIDGKFLLRSSEQIKTLNLSYIGYEPKQIYVTGSSPNLQIKLKRTEYVLPEFVVFPTENPAHRIIKNAIAYRDYNDPEKLPSFSYTSYDKMIFTPELDSIPELDSLVADTSDTEVRDFLEKHHLFIMETVSERKFRFPDKNHEQVIATKIAGFKDPIFVFLLSQMQSTTFYSDRIRIAEKEYINPISKGSTSKYFFLLQDTLYSDQGDSIFVISFRPRINTNFEGLEGVISINSNNWAIQNVIAEPTGKKGLFSFRIEQMYEFIQGKQWFPVQQNTIAILNNVAYSDSTRNLEISPVSDTSNPRVFRLPFGFGKSYIRDISLNPDLKRNEFGSVVVEVDPEASHRDQYYWAKFRIDSLTQKEINTYDFVDSVGKEENFDKAAKTLESLMTGKIPWKRIDIDINRFLKYNQYEGLAVGAGIHTGERISQVFSAGGYFRYGLGDNRFKYGGDLSVVFYHQSELELKLAYMKDVTETSGLQFFDDQPGFFKPDYFRDFLVQKMDRAEIAEGSVGVRAFNYAKFSFGLSRISKEITDNYRYRVASENVNVYFDRYDFTELRLGLRYAYGEKFIQNMRKKISMGTDYPVLWVQFTKGIRGLLEGDFDYDRIDLKVEKEFYTRYIGKTSLKLAGGYVGADVPYTNLYNGNGAYRTFTIFAANSFATMRMNEFLTSKYAALYVSHDFEKLLYKGKKFKPEFAIATNILFGWLDFKANHFFIDYQIPDKGYYESGLQINRLLNLQLYTLGLALYYRYGPYALPDNWDNFAAKFTIKFAFDRFKPAGK